MFNALQRLLYCHMSHRLLCTWKLWSLRNFHLRLGSPSLYCPNYCENIFSEDIIVSQHYFSFKVTNSKYSIKRKYMFQEIWTVLCSVGMMFHMLLHQLNDGYEVIHITQCFRQTRAERASTPRAGERRGWWDVTWLEFWIEPSRDLTFELCRHVTWLLNSAVPLRISDGKFSSF